MPQLDLTEAELKTLWLILDHSNHLLPADLAGCELPLFGKVYRAYRGIPEAA